jgi:uncharacterized RDD family membrane protein YckC
MAVREKETVSIELPEHFVLHFRLSGIGRRIIAYVIDRLIQLFFVVGIVLIGLLGFIIFEKVSSVTKALSGMGEQAFQWTAALLIFLIYGICAVGYFILFEYFWDGSTPGKRTQGIRVIRRDGRPLTLFHVAARNVLRFVDILVDVYPIGLVVMFIDRGNRRLGDFVAGTVVVLDASEAGPSPGPVDRASGPSDPELGTVVARMTPEDYKLVSGFLARRSEFETKHGENVGAAIFERVFRNFPHAPRTGEERERLLARAHEMYRDRTRVL